MSRINGNNLRLAGPKLYLAAKAALDALLRPSGDRQKVVDELASAIELAEHGSDDGAMFRFAVTPVSADLIHKIVQSATEKDAVHARLVAALETHSKVTKKRVYFAIPIDRVLFERLRNLLVEWRTYDYRATKVIKRISTALEAELAKSPLIYLASVGL